MSTVLAYDPTRRTNAALVADLRRLGYLGDNAPTLDVTYGEGRWWKEWRPRHLTASDLYASGARDGLIVHPWDYLALPLTDRSFQAVVLDPPYKLNGTSTGAGPSAADAGYGVGTWTSAEARMAEVDAAIVECARVSADVLVVKCQDQVNSGRKRWQTHRFADIGEACGMRLVDMLHVAGYRAQPSGRRVMHSASNYSTALVFRHPPTRSRRS